MNIAERFLELKGRTFKTEDGDDYELEFLPGMTDSELAALERRIPCPIPDDIRALLKVTRGFNGCAIEPFDVAGMSEGGFGLEEIFPSALDIGHDGFGNYWVVDLLSTSTSWGPIYFASHDAPVIVYQSADLNEFFDQLLEFLQPPFKGPIEFTHDAAVRRIWDQQPGAIDRAAVLSNPDAELRAFAQTLQDEWLIVDLRRPEIGDGFAWGRARSPEDIKRWGALPIFGYKPRKSLLQRLFGKK